MRLISWSGLILSVALSSSAGAQERGIDLADITPQSTQASNNRIETVLQVCEQVGLHGGDFRALADEAGAVRVANPFMQRARFSRLAAFVLPDTVYSFDDAPRIFFWPGRSRGGCSFKFYDGDQDAALTVVETSLNTAYAEAFPQLTGLDLPPYSAFEGNAAIPVQTRSDFGTLLSSIGLDMEYHRGRFNRRVTERQGEWLAGSIYVTRASPAAVQQEKSEEG